MAHGPLFGLAEHRQIAQRYLTHNSYHSTMLERALSETDPQCLPSSLPDEESKCLDSMGSKGFALGNPVLSKVNAMCCLGYNVHNLWGMVKLGAVNLPENMKGLFSELSKGNLDTSKQSLNDDKTQMILLATLRLL